MSWEPPPGSRERLVRCTDGHYSISRWSTISGICPVTIGWSLIHSMDKGPPTVKCRLITWAVNPPDPELEAACRLGGSEAAQELVKARELAATRAKDTTEAT